MKPRAWIAVAMMVAGVLLFGRLGIWQLDRLAHKRAINAANARALALPPISVTAPFPPEPESLRGRRVSLTGHFDERVHILLRGRVHDGDPGVEVITPLVLADGETVVLVNRGWLPAEDAVTARPQDYPEPGDRNVIGVAEPIGRGLGGPPMRLLGTGPPGLFSETVLDLDTLVTRLGITPAPIIVRQLPGGDVPERPRRLEPRALDEMVHVGYAFQWFLFAAGALASVAFVIHRARRKFSATA